MTTKPVRLELNNSGAWKVIGRFGADDEEHASLVMDGSKGAFVSWPATKNEEDLDDDPPF